MQELLDIVIGSLRSLSLKTFRILSWRDKRDWSGARGDGLLRNKGKNEDRMVILLES